MLRSGFRCVAALDADPVAVATYRKNLVDFAHPTLSPPSNVIECDLRSFAPETLASMIGIDHVTVVVGGPPCQGFSQARKVGGSNHGPQLKPDARRHLFQDFLRFVEFFHPKVFVIENVLGLRTAAGGEYFAAVQKASRDLVASGFRYRVHAQVEDARLLGVPQRRLRQLIVGVRMDMPSFMRTSLRPASAATPGMTLGPAICDLPVLSAAAGKPSRPYSLARRHRHVSSYGEPARKFLEEVLEVDLAKSLTSHVSRPHSPRDLRDFARLREGESSAQASRLRRVQFEFPYSRESFADRYKRQSRTAPCSTIVAHLGKDGLMFIHPTQNRSITPREAARVQTFPDWFALPPQTSHAFRLVGNAVPPLVAEALGHNIRRFMDSPLNPLRPTYPFLLLPLRQVASMSPQELRSLTDEELLGAWANALAAFPSLHPENARGECGRLEPMTAAAHATAMSLGLSGECFSLTGWPVSLAPLGGEIWRRCCRGKLTESEVYLEEGLVSRCSDMRNSSQHPRSSVLPPINPRPSL